MHVSPDHLDDEAIGELHARWTESYNQCRGRFEAYLRSIPCKREEREERDDLRSAALAAWWEECLTRGLDGDPWARLLRHLQRAQALWRRGGRARGSRAQVDIDSLASAEPQSEAEARWLSEREDWLRGLIGKLPAALREVELREVELYALAFEGRTADLTLATAVALDIRPGTVRVRHARARATLRRLARRWLPPPRPEARGM
jgi:hypothetical protein